MKTLIDAAVLSVLCKNAHVAARFARAKSPGGRMSAREVCSSLSRAFVEKTAPCPHVARSFVEAVTHNNDMSKAIYITLPASDVLKSLAFFKAIGFSHNPQFTGDTAACIIISETISVMLLPHAKFAEFSPKAICDTSKAAEALFGVSCESRAQVDDMIAKAGEAGATIYERGVDYGFMYHSSFADLDGHLWALNCMSGTPPQS